MAVFIRFFAFSLVATTFLTGCSGGGKSGKSDSEGPYTGDLYKLAQKTYDPNEWYAGGLECDARRAPQIIEISRALESKRAQLDQMRSSELAESNIPVVQWGQVSFTNRPFQPSRIGWKNETYGWDSVIALYNEIKDLPNDQRWLEINNDARSLLSDDSDRLVDWVNLGTSRSRQPMIQALWPKVAACVSQQNCLNIAFTAEEIAFFQDGMATTNYLETFENEELSARQRRQGLIRLFNLVEIAIDRYAFRKENSFRFVAPNRLVVPIDLSVFDSDASKFKNYVESVWNIGGQIERLEIEFRPQVDLNVYKVFVDMTIGGREYVTWSEKKMQLYNKGRIRTVAHEFGHVLGFRDTYYTSFNKTTCDYSFESNAGDLMSSSGSGSVLPEHWTKLKEVYFK